MADLDKEQRPKLLVVCGPTASGKTSLSVSLAKLLDGEIISADSMQIYRGLDVGTAKITAAEMDGVPHHLVSICDPEIPFSVAEYVQLARQKIEEITARGYLPILAGGTGLYISSLLSGLRFTQEEPLPGVRERLVAEAEDLGADRMWQRLQQVDPETAAAIHPNNVKRVLRALEIFEQTGHTMSGQAAASHPDTPPYDALVIGLRFADRELLYARIGQRVDQMLRQGLLDEAFLVYQNRERYTTAAQAIGYKEFFPYFENAAELTECIEELKRASRRYAKRQLTWFGRMKEICWLQPDVSPDLTQEALEVIRQVGFSPCRTDFFGREGSADEDDRI